jgi:hypothetical protein
MQQVRAEGEFWPRWLRPLRPLRRPREPIEVNLMGAILKQKGRIVCEVPAPRHNLPTPVMQRLFLIGHRRRVGTAPQEYILYCTRITRNWVTLFGTP